MTVGRVPDIVAKRRLGVVFTRGEALAAGMTLAQLRSPAVRRVYRGVFTTADPTALAVRARAAIRLAGHGAVVCETTGLALLGVDLPNAALADTVHILLPRGVTGPQMAGIAVHHDTCTQPRKRFNADLVSVNPAECWLQAARALSVKDLVVLADGLMRRHDPILFLENLADQVAGSDGHRGVRRARKALALARAGTDSPMETLIRLALVEAGLPCPIVNHPVTAGSSYSLDMAYPDVHLGVEYDGAYHGASPAQVRRDQTRRRRIEDRGWRIITATADDLRDLSDLVSSVRRALGL